MVDKVLPLDQLLNGQSANILRIEGQTEHVHRLEEFGLRSGVQVEMFRRGTPCIIRLGSGKICLRNGDLVNVLVDTSTAKTN